MSISVVLPNYNHAPFLEKAMQAIYSQSIEPYEVIVIDDASMDHSLEVLEPLKKTYGNLKVLRHETNLGPISAVNLGIKHAKGEYICFCAADDIVLTHFFEKLKNVLDTHPEVALCTSDFCVMQDDLLKPDVQPLLPKKTMTVIHPEQLAKYIRQEFFWIPTNTTLYRSAIVKRFIGLKEPLKWMSDWFLNYQIASHYSIAYLPEYLALFRIEQSSYSLKKKTWHFRTKTFQNLFYEIEKQPEKIKKMIKDSGVLYQQGKWMLFFLLVSPSKWKYFIKTLKMYVRYKFTNGKRAKNRI